MSNTRTDAQWLAVADRENAKASCVGAIAPEPVMNWQAMLARLQQMDSEIARLRRRVAYLEGATPV